MIKETIVRAGSITLACVMVIGIVFAGLALDSCRKEEPKKDSYELRISDEDGFHIVVPRD